MAKDKKTKTKAKAAKSSPKRKASHKRSPKSKVSPKSKAGPKSKAKQAEASPKSKTSPKSKAKQAKASPKSKAKKAKASAAPKPKAPILESLAIEAIVLASPERVYAAWLDGTEHSAFTGGEAIIDAIVGGKHSAWSGYIEGQFLELEPGRRIVMSWRTSEFEETDPDSRAEVRFSPDGGGTRIEIAHTDLPPGGAQKYGTGWREFYFVPMRRYFESDARQDGDSTSA